MEFGLFNSLYTPRRTYENETDQWAVEGQRLQNEINWTIAADRAGFKYTWATEHHFLKEYSHISANEAFLGSSRRAPSASTSARGIINITPPVNHPARVAERVAMMDHLSGGRFEFGTGRGSSTTEQARLRHHRSRDDEGDVRRGDPRVQAHVARRTTYTLRRQVLLDARAQRAARSPT